MDTKTIGSMASGLLMTFVVVAIATTLVLPNRPTPTVITLFFGSFTNAVKATLGTLPKG